METEIAEEKLELIESEMTFQDDETEVVEEVINEEDIDIVEEVNDESDEASIELEENKEDELEHDENNTSRLADKVAAAQPQA